MSAFAKLVQHCEPQIGPRCRTLDQPSYRRVGESVRPGASDNQSHLQHVLSSATYVGSYGKHASASTASPKKLGVLLIQKTRIKSKVLFKEFEMRNPAVPSVDQLLVLLAVAEVGSLGGAAKRPWRATSAISYAIDTPEEQLGLSLFDRGTPSFAAGDCSAPRTDTPI
jgi:hypothetical protein